MKITAVEGNRQWLDGGAMFGNAPRPVWEKWIPPDDAGRIPLACRCLLIETENAKILCEAGIGAFFEPKLASRFGVETPDRHRLLENLATHGVAPEQIDFVVLSHLHFDHAGGLLPIHSSSEHALVFPKAKFLVGEEAWARALNPHPRDRASFVPKLNQWLADSGRLVVVGQDPVPAPIDQLLEFIYSHGHTPGQMHALVRGPHQKVFFCGDLIPGRPWVHIPITMGYDRFPEKLIDEKTEVLNRATKENWLLFFTHDAEAAAAHLALDESGRFIPTQVQRDIVNFAI